MNTSELKPCPFCGGTPIKRHSSGDERDGYADRVSYACPSCGCSQGAIGDSSKSGYADNSKVESQALARWNTRAPADKRVAELEGLLGTARMYIEDLADSLGNACEFFEGEDDEDPQAQGECDEARKFANRIRSALGQELRP